MSEKTTTPRKRRHRAAYHTPGRSKRHELGGVRALLRRRGWWIAAARVIFIGFIMGGLALVYFAAQLPDIGALDTIKKQQGITIESADGRIIANYGDVYGRYLTYDQLPKSLVTAVIATEDRRFFEHHGVDFLGIARAIVTNISRGHMVQGGSTITQQVAKNVFLTPERTLKRKLQELLLSFWLEARFSKKEIMAIYLNRVYLGAGAFGVDAAAKRYFNKNAHDISLYESALLAGLLKAPSRYSPAADTQRAKARVHQVLLNMVDAGYLRKKDVAPTIANYAKLPAQEAQGGNARYYTDWILDEIPNLVGQVDEDMIVTTTMDTKLQTQAQEALVNVINTQGEKKRVAQGAVVAMTPDGAVQAMVGGLSYAKSQYNRASQARRQPGSSFKLFVYLAALEAGMTPQSMVEDAPITLQVGNKTWSPDNFETGGYRGAIPMVEAIRYSLNTVSVRLSQYAGISRVADMAMRLGVPNIPNHPSIALGAVEATLLEMTGAYAHLPNGGKAVVPYGITNIRTRDGTEIYKREAVDSNPVLARGTIEMMNYMLIDAATRGTGAKAALDGRQAAGKTGTSQDYKDAWFIGFTPQLVTGVWVGNDDNRSMKRVTGGALPASIWHDFMTVAMQGKPVQSIPSSAGSGEGLLPWLFGGEHAAAPENKPAAAESGGSEVAVPEDSPFAHSDAALPEAIREDNGAGDVDNGIQAAPPAATAGEPGAAGGERGNDAVLSPQFWEKLMKKIPEKGRIEYNYPEDDRRF